MQIEICIPLKINERSTEGNFKVLELKSYIYLRHAKISERKRPLNGFAKLKFAGEFTSLVKFKYILIVGNGAQFNFDFDKLPNIVLDIEKTIFHRQR